MYRHDKCSPQKHFFSYSLSTKRHRYFFIRLGVWWESMFSIGIYGIFYRSERKHYCSFGELYLGLASIFWSIEL